MLAIEVEFLLGRAVATRVDERTQAEWPPHPQRLFSALVASHADLDLGAAGERALQWLESLPAPQVCADAAPSHRQVHSHWVPVNDEAIKADKGKTDPRHPLERRNRQERFFPAVVPADPVVTYQWPSADGVESHRAALIEIVRHLSYLGHSSSPVRAQVRDALADPTWLPDDDGDLALRVPGPGRLARLQQVHELRQGDESTQPPLGRIQAYSESAPADDNVFARNALVLAFDAGPRVSLDSALPLMQHLRDAVLSRLQEPAPPSLSGHEADGSATRAPHLAFAPLAFVDARHADGSIKGAALILPRDIDPAARRRLRLAIDSPWQLHLGPLGSIRLRLIDSAGDELKALRFGRYTRASQVWASITPVVLDRHPKKNGLGEETIIADSCERIGLPRPVEVRTGAVSAISGVPRALDFQGHATQTRDRLRRHVWLRFAEPVRGPVLIGAGRFAGLGLCLPLAHGHD